MQITNEVSKFSDSAFTYKEDYQYFFQSGDELFLHVTKVSNLAASEIKHKYIFTVFSSFKMDPWFVFSLKHL